MDLRSRMVAIFKVLLPLAALAILATLFLLSRSDDETFAIPFAEDEIAGRMRDQQVTAPFFSGTTPKGDQIILTAALARPGGADTPAEAVDLGARLTLAQGGRITLDADTGSVNVRDDIATFAGNVRIATDTGLRLQTELLNTALGGISGHAPGPVTGSGPMGTLTAGGMRFEAKNEGGPVHVLFNNGVKLIYDPKQSETDP